MLATDLLSLEPYAGQGQIEHNQGVIDRRHWCCCLGVTMVKYVVVVVL